MATAGAKVDAIMHAIIDMRTQVIAAIVARDVIEATAATEAKDVTGIGIVQPIEIATGTGAPTGTAVASAVIRTVAPGIAWSNATGGSSATA